MKTFSGKRKPEHGTLEKDQYFRFVETVDYLITYQLNSLRVHNTAPGYWIKKSMSHVVSEKTQKIDDVVKEIW